MIVALIWLFLLTTSFLQHLEVDHHMDKMEVICKTSAIHAYF